MTYHEQLLQPEWIEKRLEILERDDYKCVKCGLERPQFRGLIKSFGICSMTGLIDKGYIPQFLENEDLDYASLSFIKDGRRYWASYLGDPNRELHLPSLQFALLFRKVISAFGVGFLTSTTLVSFYQETISGQELFDLNIHHQYYIAGLNAWEYENSALVTLCPSCHRNTHLQEDVYTYDQKGGVLFKNAICPKCNGSGYLKEYSYYKEGICFQCSGEGVLQESSKSS